MALLKTTDKGGLAAISKEKVTAVIGGVLFGGLTILATLGHGAADQAQAVTDQVTGFLGASWDHLAAIGVGALGLYTAIQNHFVRSRVEAQAKKV